MPALTLRASPGAARPIRSLSSRLIRRRLVLPGRSLRRLPPHRPLGTRPLRGLQRLFRRRPQRRTTLRSISCRLPRRGRGRCAGALRRDASTAKPSGRRGDGAPSLWPARVCPLPAWAYLAGGMCWDTWRLPLWTRPLRRLPPRVPLWSPPAAGCSGSQWLHPRRCRPLRRRPASRHFGGNTTRQT